MTVDVSLIDDILSEAVDRIRRGSFDLPDDKGFDPKDFADKIDAVRGIVHQLSEAAEIESDPMDHQVFMPKLDQLNDDLAVYKIPAPAPAEPSELPKFHLVLEKSHWEEMNRPGYILVTVAPSGGEN